MGEVLEQLGGVATRARLIDATSRSEVDAALATGDVVALARGRYALPAADEAVRAAHRVTGVLVRSSAALHLGWPVLRSLARPQVAVPRNRELTAAQSAGLDLWRPRLGPDDVCGISTSRDRTLTDCLRGPSFAEALAVADSALRDGYSVTRLRALARDLRGPGSALARRVAALADDRAANPFESGLRAVAHDVPGLTVVPQVALRGGGRFLGRPDLVDERLGIVLEADSFEWHGTRQALVRDAQRYNLFAVHGWLVLRFTWEDVVLHPGDVDVVLRAAVADRTNRCPCRHSAA